jgi:peptidyl-prolyl cis-trans isomerase B (cyclophilin B)
MLKLRTGLLLATLLLCACDHHKNTTQAQTGAAAVGQNESEFTGEPSTPTTNSPPYPRALPVADANAPTSTGVPVATASTPTTPVSDTTTAPALAPLAATTSSPSPADNSSPAPATMPMADTSSATAPPSAAPSSDNAPDTTAPTPPAATGEQVVVIDTTLGRIVIETDDSAAPKTSENFRKLAADGFYNHTIFHRVIPHFIIQGGDPNSLSEDRSIQGKGGPGYTLPPEIKLKHERGAVAMARLPDAVNPGRESNGSQFYICVVDSPSLDNQYTVFGHVIKGMDVVDAISNQARDNRDNPINRLEMEVTIEPKEQAMSAGPSANP